MKVEDWIASAEQMTRHLESNMPLDPNRLNADSAQLKRMAGFITKQESDARGWIKDQRQLQIALDALAQRKATITQLISVCAKLV